MSEPQTCSNETVLPSLSKLQSIWAWLKSLFATSTPKTHGADPLILALDLLKAQHATLDRIVQSKFDVPMHVTGPPPQGRAPMFSNYMLSDVLSVDSDEEFLQKTESLSN
jgi:hypothetical protein